MRLESFHGFPAVKRKRDARKVAGLVLTGLRRYELHLGRLVPEWLSH